MPATLPRIHAHNGIIAMLATERAHPRGGLYPACSRTSEARPCLDRTLPSARRMNRNEDTISCNKTTATQPRMSCPRCAINPHHPSHIREARMTQHGHTIRAARMCCTRRERVCLPTGDSQLYRKNGRHQNTKTVPKQT
jgi:hypothetical protein